MFALRIPFYPLLHPGILLNLGCWLTLFTRQPYPQQNTFFECDTVSVFFENTRTYTKPLKPPPSPCTTTTPLSITLKAAFRSAQNILKYWGLPIHSLQGRSSAEETQIDSLLKLIIIHQTHYEKSDWSRAFSQLTIACELDMINAISAADIAFIMSSSTSAWLLSPLESSQKQNGWTLRFCFWGWV